MFASTSTLPDFGTGIPNPQPDLSELAEKRLGCNSYHALKSVSCNYLDGVLVLRGHLPTFYLKQMAQEVLVRLAGIVHIDNQIQVI